MKKVSEEILKRFTKIRATQTLPNANNNNEIVPTDLSKIPTVTYCDLIKNAAEYVRKLVRVRAIYFNAFERSYLCDERCEINQPPKTPSAEHAQSRKLFVPYSNSYLIRVLLIYGNAARTRQVQKHVSDDNRRAQRD